MTTHSPFEEQHRDAAAIFLPYGPPHAPIQVPALFGEPELEYAAIRKTAGLMDLPQRGLLRVSGTERITFLSNMLTQEVKSAGPGAVRQSFWLNRQGRIQADLTLAFEEETLWISVDAHQAAGAARSLGEFLFAEDVQIEDVSETHHQIALHGPKAALYLARIAAGGEQGEAASQLFGLANLRCCRVALAGQDSLVFREDLAGAPGLNVALRREGAQAVYQALLERCVAREDERQFEMRRLGWSAFNVARIEAGTPLMNLDFGADTLPHESGVLAARVSFTKGCYLGQEVVARIESQGQPKQKLMALKVQGERLPRTGDHVIDPASEATVVGAVTSSAPSPLLGRTPLCLAMLKTAFASPGKPVRVGAEGTQAEATVQDLGFVGVAGSG